MNRKILIQVTAPAVVIGLLLFGTCLVSAWLINRMQTNMSSILTQNVTSLEEAQEMEINLRRLRFLCYRYLVDPDPSVQKDIEEVNGLFRASLARARHTANSPEEVGYLDQIEEGYERYQQEYLRLQTTVISQPTPRDFRALADANPVRHVVVPCERLLEINKQTMQQTAQENEKVSQMLRFVLLLLGLGGPASGLIMGYGIARGLSRSIYQLSVRVHDMAQRLEQDVASLSVAGDGDLEQLDQQMQQVVGRVEEVTSRLQQHQAEMLRAQQLAAVGQLAASVAHEVRNPLTSMKLLVDSARRSNNRKPLTLEDLQVIHGEIVRLEGTVQNFLDFARPPRPRLAPCDLRDIVSRAIELTQVRAQQQKVNVERRRAECALLTDADPSQLCTVLVNLLFNALDALPQGGRIEVASRLKAHEPGSDAADWIELTICDNGPGIAPEMKDRLFTPFASTKATGTGLGLSISRRIIEEHGGRLRGETRPEGGACFTIELPTSEQRQKANGRRRTSLLS